MCYMSMSTRVEVPVGVRELRQNLSVYLARLATGAVFRVTDADAVNHGLRTHPIRPFLLTVSVAEAPLAIDSISSEIVFDPCIGSCLRAGQPLATSVGAPTFRLGGIRVDAASGSTA